MCVCVCMCVWIEGGYNYYRAKLLMWAIQICTKHSHTCKGGVQRKKHKLQNTVTPTRGEYSAKITNYKTQSHMQGGSTAQKAQITKHSHTCKGRVQRKKHKLQNTVTHARGKYSAKKHKLQNTVTHMQGRSTAQKAQTTKHSHTCKGGVQRKKHKLQNTVTHARGEYSAKSTNYKTQSHMYARESTAQKAQTTKRLVRERVTLCTRQYSLFLRSIVFLSDVQWVDHHQHPTE